jgi:hypothetical protein
LLRFTKHFVDPGLDALQPPVVEAAASFSLLGMLGRR